MTGVPSWLTDMNNSIQGIVDYVTNNNYLEYAVSSGFGDVPIAAYGMVVIVLSTFAYATVADPKNITSLSNVTYNMVKSVPGLSNSDSVEIKRQFTKEKEEEQKEEEKQREKEEEDYKKVTEEEEKEKEEEEKEKDEEESNSKKKEEDEDDEDYLKGGSRGTPPLNKRLAKKTYRKRESKKSNTYKKR
jgi:hypothetical protein